MSDHSSNAPQNRPVGGVLHRKSSGLKLLLVCGLALLMAIPAGFVWGLVFERKSNSQDAVMEVSVARGGEQTLLGPVIEIPYERLVREQAEHARTGEMVERTVKQHGSVTLFAETGAYSGAVETELLRRGIHDVPVFNAKIDMSAEFSVSPVTEVIPKDAQILWQEARLLMYLSDLRGIRDSVTVQIGGQMLELSPAAGGTMRPGSNTMDGTMQVSLASLGLEEREGFELDASIGFTGAQSLALAAFAKDTRADLTGDWSTPSFEGQFLPVERDWSDAGFSANWRVPYLARGIAEAGTDINIWSVAQKGMGVRFLDEANPYQSVTRALKYAPMFIGLVFLAYFLFETVSGVRAHPAQYVLVGLAQTIFYLLLLGISEHLGFTPGFLMAAVATVMLLSLYAGAVFKSRSSMLQAFIAFSLLYSLIYVLMRLDDYALLVGAVASFTAIAATMFMTRNLDWYGLSSDEPAKAS